MDMLKLSVLTPHHATTGCKCRECYSLTEYMHALTGSTYGLPRPEPALRPVPAPLSAFDACTGAMTCDCSKCAAERAERLKAGSKRIPQPWEPKRAA